MADLREAMRLITGDEVSPERVQRVMAIAHALDIPQSDAMLPIFVALDSYRETLSATATAAIHAMQRAAERAAPIRARPIRRQVATAAAIAVIAAAVGWVMHVHGIGGSNPDLERWATSPAGRAAYAFDRANPERGVWLLTACNFPGWRRATHLGRPACLVGTEDGKDLGWYLPPESRK